MIDEFVLNKKTNFFFLMHAIPHISFMEILASSWDLKKHLTFIDPRHSLVFVLGSSSYSSAMT